MTPAAPRRPIYSPLTNAGEAKVVGRKGVGKHLQPGVVAYDQEDGSRITYLLPLEAIERMRPSAAGKPVVGKAGGFDHLKIEPGKKYDGQAVDSFWDGESGWEAFHFDQMNQETADACEKGYQVSCAYVPTEVDETPGKWHNVDYDAVIKNGEYTHFAVVPNPRYDGATIEILNSKGGGIVKKTIKAILAALAPFPETREVYNALADEEKKKEEGRAKAKADFDNAMKNATSDEEKKKAKDDYEKANAVYGAADDAAEPSEAEHERMKREKQERISSLRNEADALEKEIAEKQKIGGGDVPPEPGVPGQAGGAPGAVNADETPEQKAAQEKEAAEKLALEKKNADDAAAKDAEAKKAKDEKDKADKERENKNALAAKAKADAELKVKAAADAKKEAERVERFNTLRRAAEERGGSSGTPFIGVVSVDEKEDLGRERYGSPA